MSFYDRLSHSLFGTEEIVDIRQKLALLRERLRNGLQDKTLRMICTGSLGEGIAYPRSDDDFMIYSDKNQVVRKCSDAVKRLHLVLSYVKDSPGYCLLLDINRSYAVDVICFASGVPIVSSFLWKQKYTTAIEGDSVHGPCCSFVLGREDFDCAFCILCNFWPDSACNWINRNRANRWPSHEIIQTIVRNKCHVVPVGDPDSPFHDHSWRISFSDAERTLIHSFNHVQSLTYSILRLVLKRIIERRTPNVLCSYFMKTTVFYTCENTSRQLWVFDNLNTCVQACLSTLIAFIDCPNYFIPEYNMIKRKINHRNQHQVLEMLTHLYAIGVVGCVHLSGESRCLEGRFSLPTMEWKMDRELLFSVHHDKVLARLDDFFGVFGETFTDTLSRIVHVFTGNDIFRCNAYFNILLYEVISLYCKKLMHNLYSHPVQNKNIYHIHKTIKALLRIGQTMDMTTGHLTTATYLFMVGRTKHALYSVHNTTNAFKTPSIRYGRFIRRKQFTSYVEVMCGKGYTMYHKARHSLAPLYYMPRTLRNAFPSILRIFLVVLQNLVMHPLVYASLLETLCYIRLKHVKDRTSTLKSTKLLMQRIDDFNNISTIASARICIGLIEYVQGHTNSVCRWLGSAYSMKRKLEKPVDEDLCFSVLTYVACLLNRHYN